MLENGPDESGVVDAVVALTVKKPDVVVVLGYVGIVVVVVLGYIGAVVLFRVIVVEDVRTVDPFEHDEQGTVIVTIDL